VRADAILVSQVITQRNCHKENGRSLVELLERQGWRRDVLLLFGGPRVDHAMALELGFDAGFGPGTKPADVASYLVERMCGAPATG
jgi:beta-lysine 5,6-aminomutase beta subunit